ncbi:MAG: glycosyltransferase, partial [Ignavibacteria bacterium]
MADKKALVIIPTYNEMENIPKLLPLVLTQDEIIDILIVDDNSPDGTANWVKQQTENNGRIKLLEREKKLGLGTAY